MTGTQAKATRLLAEGRVTPHTAPVWVFDVYGDTGRYVTVVGAHVATCSCPATTRCSHIEAAVTWVHATDEERALMVELRERRVAQEAADAEALFAQVAS